ncbi:MAG TPA: ribonuclease HII [Bacteroidales bacterium]|mgnify:FL=1|nr:ribonuclease HII [Bacteroidales bacterium]
MLEVCFQSDKIEAGCDEAGRGCLAGPVFAAAVILPKNCNIEGLNDSKKLSEAKRYELRPIIEEIAVAYAVAYCTNEEIDKFNILRASIMAMHRSLDKLKTKPEFIVVDGNRFYVYKDIPHQTIVKGDGKYMNIAAASVLAKTYRDDFMLKLHEEFPQYHWDENKGYPTQKHVEAIEKYGYTKYHRKSFHLKSDQLSLF